MRLTTHMMILVSIILGSAHLFSPEMAQASDQATVAKQQREFLRLRKKLELEVERQIAAESRAWERKQTTQESYQYSTNPLGLDIPTSIIDSTMQARIVVPAQTTDQTKTPCGTNPKQTSPRPEIATSKTVELPTPLSAPLRKIDQTVVERDGALQIMNRMTCAPGNSICQQICQSNACEWPEPLCRDCFGTGSEVMRDVFVRLSSSYRVLRTISDAGLIEGLMARSMVLVSQKSPYDFFNSSSDPGLSPHLMTMCGSTNGFVAVVLDNDGRPSKAVVAICSTDDGVKAALIEHTDDSRSEVLQPIQLKMATDLIAIPKP